GGAPGPAAGPPASGAVLNITAKDLAFNPRSLTARPNTAVTVAMNNQDEGIQHNFSVFRNNRATDPMSPGSVSSDLFTGPGVHNFNFTTAGPGTYYFRCDVHPDQMNGSFIVR